MRRPQPAEDTIALHCRSPHVSRDDVGEGSVREVDLVDLRDLIAKGNRVTSSAGTEAARARAAGRGRAYSHVRAGEVESIAGVLFHCADNSAAVSPAPQNCGGGRELRRTFVALRDVEVFQLVRGVDELEDRLLSDLVKPDHLQCLSMGKERACR